MVQMAFVGTAYQDQMQANPEGLDGVEVAWNGSSPEELMRAGASPQVVVVDLERLGDDPKGAIERLRRTLQPELVLVIYRFAKREVVQNLQGKDTRVLQGPVSLTSLRSQILGLLVRELFSGDSGSALVRCPRCGSRVAADVLSS